ncbi:uncharacterized protein LOC120830512 [Gasterosteus aculeatus]
MEGKNMRPLVPWYKEKLQTKYLKASANRISSVGTCFRFSSANLDESSLSLGDRGCVSPMTRKQIRREYVAAVEKKLQQRPLATFPHYREHMTPQLFDEVVSILDPELSVNRAATLPTTTGDHVEEEDEEVNRAKHK